MFFEIYHARSGLTLWVSTVGLGLLTPAGVLLRYITHFAKMAMMIITISSRIPLRCPFVK